MQQANRTGSSLKVGELFPGKFKLSKTQIIASPVTMGLVIFVMNPSLQHICAEKVQSGLAEGSVDVPLYKYF